MKDLDCKKLYITVTQTEIQNKVGGVLVLALEGEATNPFQSRMKKNKFMSPILTAVFYIIIKIIKKLEVREGKIH